MTVAVLVTGIAAASALSTSAEAAVPPGETVSQVEELAAQARQAYGEGRFEAAIGYYLRAYRLEPAGALMYNIAYVYDRKLHEPELAVAYYRKYVQAPDAEPDVVERAIERIGELKGQSGSGGTARPKPVRPDPRPTPPPVVARPAASGMSGQAIGGWITLGLGTLGLVGAGTMSLLADDTQSEFASTSNLERAHELRDTGQGRALAADVLWGVGGAAVVAGLVLVLTAPDASPGREADTGSGALGVRASFGPEGVLVLVGGRL